MPSELADHWTLDPSVTFLNHGSFGATPRPVLDAQTLWRERMEREPVAFFARDLEPALDEARAALAAFVGAEPDDLAFVANATAGVNAVARSLVLRPGDDVVVLDHAYNAARNALEAVATTAGARVVSATLPFPGSTPDAAVAAVMDAATARTRLVLLDHVTSPTALVLPARQIVARLEERGIDTLVDGAHAPGMIEVDVGAIGATYYTANCHKWMSAPKGSAFVHVRRDRQARVRPLAISHGANSSRVDRSRFRLEHDWIGRLDPTPWLAVPAAIEFGEGLMPGGWPALRARGHELTLVGRELVMDALEQPSPAPEVMIGAMASIPLSPGPALGAPPADQYADPVHAAFQAAGIQVAVTPWPQRPERRPWRRLIRFSVPPYIDRADLERLASAIPIALASA